MDIYFMKKDIMILIIMKNNYLMPGKHCLLFVLYIMIQHSFLITGNLTN